MAKSPSQFEMDSALQQLSQILFLQSLASPPASGKSSMNSTTQFGQLPMTPKMPSLLQLPTPISSQSSSSDQSNLAALAAVTKILSAHQNLKTQLSPISSRSGFNPQMMQTFNPNDFRLSPFQLQNQQQQQLFQHQPEYRIAVTRESAKPLQNWMKENIHHPYPTSTDISDLSKKTGFTHKQIRNWFTNNRRRYEQENSNLPLPWHKKLASNRKSSSPKNVPNSQENILSSICQLLTPSSPNPEQN